MAAIAEKPTATATAQHVLRKVGPLTCRFHTESSAVMHNAIPSVESLAAEAESWLGRIAYTRAAVRDAKRQREAAKREVLNAGLLNSKSVKFTQAQLAPLITDVRKELNRRVRQAQREHDKRKRAEEREEQRAAARKKRLREQAVKRETAKVHCAVLPETARPVKVTASKNSNQPALQGGHITRVGRDKDATWQLIATDAYQATVFPLAVHGDPRMRECVIPPAALQAIQTTGAFRFDKDGRVQAISYSTRQITVSLKKPADGGFGRYGEHYVTEHVPYVAGEESTLYLPLEGVKPVRAGKGKTAMVDDTEPPAKRRIDVTIDASILLQVQQAFGHGQNAVTLQLDVGKFDRHDDGVRRTLKPMRVVPGGKLTRQRRDAGLRAVQMPVRDDH